MEIHNLSSSVSILNRYLAEVRDKDYQQHRLLFRNNIRRIGEMMAYEMSRTLSYEERAITTPLGSGTITNVIGSTYFKNTNGTYTVGSIA